MSQVHSVKKWAGLLSRNVYLDIGDISKFTQIKFYYSIVHAAITVFKLHIMLLYASEYYFAAGSTML